MTVLNTKSPPFFYVPALLSSVPPGRLNASGGVYYKFHGHAGRQTAVIRQRPNRYLVVSLHRPGHRCRAAAACEAGGVTAQYRDYCPMGLCSEGDTCTQMCGSYCHVCKVAQSLFALCARKCLTGRMIYAIFCQGFTFVKRSHLQMRTLIAGRSRKKSLPENGPCISHSSLGNTERFILVNWTNCAHRQPRRPLPGSWIGRSRCGWSSWWPIRRFRRRWSIV